VFDLSPFFGEMTRHVVYRGKDPGLLELRLLNALLRAQAREIELLDPEADLEPILRLRPYFEDPVLFP
jgi:hypothetical protein